MPLKDSVTFTIRINTRILEDLPEALITVYNNLSKPPGINELTEMGNMLSVFKI